MKRGLITKRFLKQGFQQNEVVNCYLFKMNLGAFYSDQAELIFSLCFAVWFSLH